MVESTDMSQINYINKEKFSDLYQTEKENKENKENFEQ